LTKLAMHLTPMLIRAAKALQPWMRPLADVLEALLDSIASLPNGMWHMWMMRICEAMPTSRMRCFLDSNALEGPQPH
jgi:hypothetical protein